MAPTKEAIPINSSPGYPPRPPPYHFPDHNFHDPTIGNRVQLTAPSWFSSSSWSRLAHMITEFTVTAGEGRKRLDVFLLGRERNTTRSQLQRLISLGRIRLNAKVVTPGHKVKPGDRITFDIPQPGPFRDNNKSALLEVLFEDETLLIVNKPPGIVVHPTSGHWAGTLLNAAMDHVQRMEISHEMASHFQRPKIVHRLDVGTSGVMIIAKTDLAHRILARQFEQHTITRIYEALVLGLPESNEGVITLAIGRDCNNSKVISTHSENPKSAVTTFEAIERLGSHVTRVRLSPQTGRTHQLRVHMASLNCPILGDTTYGGRQLRNIGGIEIPRVMLHASRLSFLHPLSRISQQYEVDIPLDMKEIREKLRK